jgi:hypothetical protein
MIAHFVPALLFGLIGLIVEIVFTGIYKAIEERNLKALSGHVSLFMFPVYAGSYHIFSALSEYFKSYPEYQIYFFITLVIYFCEYCWGWIYLNMFNIRAWYYTHQVRIGKRVYNLHLSNFITAIYFPFWYIFSIGIWEYSKFIDTLIQRF